MTPVGRDDSARRTLQGFALRGDLLCPRRQRRQNAAGGGLRWASPPIVAPPPDPRNLRGPNSGGRWDAVRRGRDNDCPRIRAAAAVGPKSRRLDWLDQTGAPDRSGSNLCGGERAGGSESPPLQGNFGRYGFTAAPGSDQPWQRVQVGVRRTDPSPEDRDARRARRLGAPPYRVSLACLPPQNVSPPPRRGGACPFRRPALL